MTYTKAALYGLGSIGAVFGMGVVLSPFLLSTTGFGLSVKTVMIAGVSTVLIAIMWLVFYAMLIVAILLVAEGLKEI